MGKNVLISSLGYAPGSVTGTVDAIKCFDGEEIHEVITISTSEPQIVNIAVRQILETEFKNTQYYPNGIEYSNVKINSRDIKKDEDNIQFLEKFVSLFRENIEDSEIDGIYISLAGGRKTMASLIFIGVKLIVDCYEDDENSKDKFREITHLIVDDPDVEREGVIEYLKDAKGTEFYNKCMHPVSIIGKEKVKLIKLSGIFKNADELREECKRLRNGEIDINVLARYMINQ
ncbi:hypothetical protein GF312_20365 [Candidatus Poribacteria bacterium]|nr:hypothetical protein [Candidatus Poribacteria bacterium]